MNPEIMNLLMQMMQGRRQRGQRDAQMEQVLVEQKKSVPRILTDVERAFLSGVVYSQGVQSCRHDLTEADWEHLMLHDKCDCPMAALYSLSDIELAELRENVTVWQAADRKYYKELAESPTIPDVAPQS